MTHTVHCYDFDLLHHHRPAQCQPTLTHLDPGGQAGEDPRVGGEAGRRHHEAVE